MTEARFKSWLVKVLREQKAFVQTIETTTGPGVPDLAVIANGKTIWIEVKYQAVPKVRKEQYVWHMQAFMRNGPVCVINQHPTTQEIGLYRSGVGNTTTYANGGRGVLLAYSGNRNKVRADLLPMLLQFAKEA